jgi:hypothetical protein
MLCVPIGRDLVRLLQDISSIPEFSQFWNDMLHSPEKLSPRFKGNKRRLTLEKRVYFLFLFLNEITLPFSYYKVWILY